MNWAGVPIGFIHKYFNSEMKGFSVYARFNQLSSNKQTRFSQLWQNCSDDLGIVLKIRMIGHSISIISPISIVVV
jgi:hypothetical protein